MTIRNRITLQFTLFTSVILIIFSVIIYVLFSNFRHDEFIGRLKDKALNSVKLLADVDEVSHELLEIIDRNAVNPMPQEKLIIMDLDDQVVYRGPGTQDMEIPTHLRERVLREGSLQFTDAGQEGVVILFKGRYDSFVVLASAFDQFGLSKLNYLRNILMVSVIISILLIALIGLFFSKQALQPLSRIVSQIDKVSASNLNLRIDEGNSKDEIAQLAIKFNRMMERLRAAFAIQRSFVANASHELRTPLTTLTGQLEVTLMNETRAEMKDVLEPLLQEIRQLNKLSNGLLDLAQADQDLSEISISTVRIDELLGAAQADLLRRNKKYRVILQLEEFPDEKWLLLKGNEQLLKSALLNVLENACKYSSDATATVELSFDDTYIHVKVKDKGIGIPGNELELIFQPFFRSGRAKPYSGHGIGLTLTRKIVELHNGTIVVLSAIDRGTEAKITLPHL